VLGHEGVAIEDDMTLGTPNYFPPEQALVEEGLDCRADMYALGATMYHLGTGCVPFGELTPDEVASQQVHGQLINPKELNSKLSWGFCCMVERLMAKDPLHRYEDWAGVMADILAVKEGRMIKTPLASNIRSTVEHTKLPASKQRKQAKKIKRAGGATRAAAPRRRGAPRRQPASSGKRVTPQGGGGTPIHRGGTRSGHAAHPGSDAAYPAVSPHPVPIVKPPQTLWPLVVGIGLVALLLYGYTFMSM
jgi:serine/threonine-protein kinase